jgi:hypothetical protein
MNPELQLEYFPEVIVLSGLYGEYVSLRSFRHLNHTLRDLLATYCVCTLGYIPRSVSVTKRNATGRRCHVCCYELWDDLFTYVCHRLVAVTTQFGIIVSAMLNYIWPRQSLAEVIMTYYTPR